MFGRKKKTVAVPSIEPAAPTPAARQFAHTLGENLSAAVEASPTSTALADAVDRLNGVNDETAGAIDTMMRGMVEAVAEARREPDPQPGESGEHNAPGLVAPHTLIERYGDHFAGNLDSLRTAEQNLVERMARNLEAYEAQRDHDAEELRQMRVAIEANEVAIKALKDPYAALPPKQTGEQERAANTALHAAHGSRRRPKSAQATEPVVAAS